MPVRTTVTQRIAELIRGVHVFDGRTGTSKTITRKQLDEARAAADAVYCDVITRIDWNRVLLEAMGLHGHVAKCSEEDPTSIHEGLCGHCVEAALLNKRRVWYEPETDTPGLDWPRVVARAVRYRGNHDG